MVKYRAFKTGSTYKLPSKIIYITSHTFYNTTTWVVPANVTRVRVDCVAAQGQTIGSGVGGKGGRVQCVLKVSPYDTLYIHVGVVPSGGDTASYNASDVRINGNSYSNRVVVAGGGGSGSWASTYGETYANGGAGGETTGGTGGTGLVWGYSATAGTGGSNTNACGGTGSTAATPYSPQKVGATGGFGLGGNGATYTGIAGAGGAGYYGGGGGATSAFADEKTIARAAGGAGGGSSYTNDSLCSSVTHTQGFQSGNGYITLSILDGDPGYIVPETVYLAYADS